ncbi:MAG: hypothetical protein LAP85_21525 [Acidobacteriia bacterium]|nr:hypothetical protein [Terriglobia bacterium]
MKLRRIILSMAVLAIAAGCAVRVWSQAKPEEKDPVLKMSQVPQKVQQAIKTYASPAEIKKITKGDVDGTMAYEFEIEKGGRKAEVSITPDGKLLTSEEEIPPSEVPEAARKVMDAHAAGGKVVSTEKVFENGKTAFGAVIEKGGKQSEISVAPDGKLTGSEEDIPLSEVPEAARKTIDAQAAGGKIISTKKVLEDGKTVFAAVFEKGGRQTEITVAPDGKLVDTEVIK